MHKLEPGDWLILIGLLLIAGGVALVHGPAGVIVAGVEFVVCGVAQLRATAAAAQSEPE